MHYLFPNRIFLYTANDIMIYLPGQSLVDIKIYKETMSIRLLMTLLFWYIQDYDGSGSGFLCFFFFFNVSVSLKKVNTSEGFYFYFFSLGDVFSYLGR